MSTEAPQGYLLGIRYVDNMDYKSILNWLKGELRGKHHLAGQADDQPVQAILNHFRFFSAQSQYRIRIALEVILIELIADSRMLSLQEATDLLHLLAELKVTPVRAKLKRLVAENLSSFDQKFGARVYSTIASLSDKSDLDYWKTVADKKPDYAGLAFQVIFHLDPEMAISILQHLPLYNESVEGSVARVLPNYREYLPR